ncbi:EthD domain-containing protein [Pelomonas sp. KK5]|uniref:EthD domain-containing protein n=1 Tax=Pelomonas sp. KK5 TaxID=1855730 RepID=UPI00097C4191|nr:EthD domain-containing protein [Pelomonas sp. KK5]
MIKIIFCLKRLPHLSRDAFQAYWREQHAPRVQARARLLGIRRYVQSHTMDDASFAAPSRARGGAAPYDGVAEIWFEADGAEGSPEACRAAALELLDDERNFIDLPASALFYTQELQVL